LAELEVKDVSYNRIDAGKYKNIAKMHKARFVPRIMVAYRKSVIPLAANYDNLDQMLAWTLKKFSEPYIKVTSDEEFSEYLERNPVVFTYFGDNAQRDFASFKELCKLHSRTTCLYISDPVMVGTHSHGSLLSLFTHFDEGRYDWGKETLYFDVLTRWAEDRMSPLVEDIDKGDAFERVFGQEKLSLVLFTNEKKAFLKEFKAFAKSENNRF